MWRMWLRSRGQKGSVFVMTSSSVLSSHSDSETDAKKKEIQRNCRNNDARLPQNSPPPSALPNPIDRYFILGSACKAPLKICKSKLLVSQGWLWEPGV